MDQCLFCRIVNKELEATIVYEDDEVMAFEDIRPQAPVHILFIPKKHIRAMAHLAEEDARLMAHLFTTITEFAAQKDELDAGYRVVVNNGNDGGQTVDHLHLHLLGGRRMGWPPG